MTATTTSVRCSTPSSSEFHRRRDADGPFQLLVSSIDYNEYVGRLGIGRIQRGNVSSRARTSS
jgi:predicted membrane GTPase involved in stress response